MHTMDSGQSLPCGAEAYPLAPRTRIPQKPVPSRNNHDSAYPLISRNGKSDDDDASSQPQSDFRGIRTQYDRLVRPETTRGSGSLRRHFDPSQNRWLFELLAAVVSVLAMVALLGVLDGYNDRVVQILPLGITLNGMVAVLATISRTSLMIPVASGLSQGKWLWFSPIKALPNGRRLEDLRMFDNASRGSWGSLELLWRLKAR